MQIGACVDEQVRISLHYAPRIALVAENTAFAGIGHKIVVPTVVTPGVGKGVSKEPRSRCLGMPGAQRRALADREVRMWTAW